MRYRVYCNFTVEADSASDVIEFLSEEGDFVESHIIVEENTRAAELLPSKSDDTYDDIYADITK